MFQYAAARRLALYHRTSLKLDLAFFQYRDVPHLTPRSYALTPFNIRAGIATPREITRITGVGQHSFSRLCFRLERKLQLPSLGEIFSEPGFAPFQPEIFKTRKNVYLQGSWQSAKYFADIAEIIRQDFTLNSDLSAASRQVAYQIEQTEAVSIHIRRGDYISDPVLSKVHNVCTLDYYVRCVRNMTERIKDAHFFIFSDEPRWVAENLKLDCPTTLVQNHTPEHEDMRLMSMCRHHIIANSSFSWWGAWLNPNPNKIVLAPLRWFNSLQNNDPRSLDTRDLLPAAWVRIDN